MTITPFTYDDQPVRVVTINDEPWFVASDVASILGHSEAYAMTRTLDDDEKGPHTVRTPGGNQSMVVISESGLYSAILRSRLAQARPFRRWVTSDVLPAIRKTGTYSATPQLSEDQIVQQALAITAARVEKLTARLAIAEPKADAFDRWLSSNVDYSVGHVANALAIAGVSNMGRNRLFAYLDECRWAYRADGQWTPYQTAIETKRLAVKLGSQLNTRTGEQFRTVTLRITAKGVAKLAVKLGAAPAVVAEALDAPEAADAA